MIPAFAKKDRMPEKVIGSSYCFRSVNLSSFTIASVLQVFVGTLLVVTAFSEEKRQDAGATTGPRLKIKRTSGEQEQQALPRWPVDVIDQVPLCDLVVVATARSVGYNLDRHGWTSYIGNAKIERILKGDAPHGEVAFSYASDAGGDSWVISKMLDEEYGVLLPRSHRVWRPDLQQYSLREEWGPRAVLLLRQHRGQLRLIDTYLSDLEPKVVDDMQRLAPAIVKINHNPRGVAELIRPNASVAVQSCYPSISQIESLARATARVDQRSARTVGEAARNRSPQ